MFRFSKRARLARIAVGLTALGASVMGASAAQAAMGTSTTLITTARPDLISVTTPGSQGGPTADFCFSKGLGVASGAAPSDFLLGGYDSEKLQEADSIAQLNNFCIEATFTIARANDLVAYSFGQVLEGAVEADEGGGENFTDSTALNGSDTNNGTRGLHHRTRPPAGRGPCLPEPDRLCVRSGGRGSVNCRAVSSTSTRPAMITSPTAPRSRPPLTVASGSCGRSSRTALGDDVTDAVIVVAEPYAVSVPHRGAARTTSGSRSRSRARRATPTTPTWSRPSWSVVVTAT